MALTKAEIMAKRISRGINVDVSQPEGGPAVKVVYDPAHYDAVKAAGFQSVRFFISVGRNPAIYRKRIQDALDRDLAVVVCLWGSPGWAQQPREGIERFAAYWDRFATYYRDFPEELVFELWNEPAGLAHDGGKTLGLKDGAVVMDYHNAAIPLIRKTNPTRTLAVGGPGFNGRRELKEFVTSEYLTYRLEDGTGFEEDTNIIGIFHMYQPHRFSHWTAGLETVPGWRDEVLEHMSHPIAWMQKVGKPAVLSEFGCWVPPTHTPEDFKAYVGFIVEECRRHDIGWIYYTAGFNNQWAFNLLHTEDGWYQDALDILTGVKAPPPPPLSQILNSEFSHSTGLWTREGSAEISVARNAGLSGPSALKVVATQSDHAAVSQQTPVEKGSPPGRYLISLKQGRLYRITFLAKSLDAPGILKVRLADVAGSRSGFWDSEPVTIPPAKREHTIEYRHVGPDVDDVRFSLLLGQRNQTILLDRIEMRGYRQSSSRSAQ